MKCRKEKKTVGYHCVLNLGIILKLQSFLNKRDNTHGDSDTIVKTLEK